MANNLSKAQIEAINNYSESIITISDFVEIVRKRPGMYLGPIGNLGFINMIREIIQNGFDQILKELSPADHIIASYNELTHQVIIEDNGMGIPFGEIIRMFTEQHTSSHFNSKEGEFSAGLHGIGSKVTNAMSSSFIVQSYIFGEGREVQFIDGKPTSDKEKVIQNPKNKQGTVVMFIPSEEALGQITTTIQDVYNLFNLILPLISVGTKIYFNTIDITGKSNSIVMENVDSIFGFIKDFPSVLKEPIYISDVTGIMKMECCFNFDSEFNSSIIGFANFCPTTSGTHINGFIDGVSYWFKNYMNNIFLSSIKSNSKKIKNNKTKQIVIELSDIKMALRGVIHAAHIEPNFTGQAKENFSNEEMLPYVKSAIQDGLKEWSSKNPIELQKICKFLKSVAELRLAENKEKVKLTNKYTSAFGGYPGGFYKPSGPKSMWEEFYIVEGESALGSAKVARIKQIQGLYAIRGKLPNAFNKSEYDILNNEECKAIFNIIGGGVGKSFDLSKVFWKRVGPLADADVDGGHIATLQLILLLVYCRPLVEDGRVYKAIPPLYGAEIRGKMKYFTDSLDFAKYRQKEFCKSHVITHANGDKLSDMEILALLYLNEDYIYEVNRIRDTYSIDALLLETLLLNRTLNLRGIEKSINSNKRFRFIKNTNQTNDTIIIEGLVNMKYNTAFLNDKLIKESSNIINLLDQNTEYYFKLDNNLVSLYTLMYEFDKNKPTGMRRFKGLGEMSGEQLRESTLDPEGTRSIIQYTAKDIIEEVETMRYLNSNMNLIGENVKIRRLDLMD